MRCCTRFLVLAAVPALCLAAAPPALAQGNPFPSHIDWSAPARWTAANLQWWNSLTPRQQQLERAIGAVEQEYKANTGQYFIPVSDENVRAMMQRVGARPHEAGWVRYRMEDYATFGRNLQMVDRNLEIMQRDPYWYLPPHMKPRP